MATRGTDDDGKAPRQTGDSPGRGDGDGGPDGPDGPEVVASATGAAMMGIGAAAQALAVSVDTLRRWEKAGRIRFERVGGRRVIEAAEVASLLRERHAVGHSSARNRLEGIVLSVRRDHVMAQVELACGPFRIVSLMSREAADELGLAPGVPAAAVVKSTTVVVETLSETAAPRPPMLST